MGHYKRQVDGAVLNLCVVCGFGVVPVLEVAHLDQNRSNNHLDNLAVLCPNCHKMHDIGLLDTDLVREMRDAKFQVNWKLRVKNAGEKAAATRKLKAKKLVKSAAGNKAWTTRAAKLEGNNEA